MPRRWAVVDASVAIKWVLPEEGREQALRIQELYANDRLDLLAPYLLVPETHNVLWKRVRRNELTAAQARRCAQYLALFCPLLMDSEAIGRSALELALAHGRTVYDCMYLALALEYRCDLITADQKFLTAMRPAFPCLRSLQDW